MSRFLAFLILATAMVPTQATQDFEDWLSGLQTEAQERGISSKVLSSAFADVRGPIPRVISLDRNQPEGKLTFEQYLQNVLPDFRIQQAKRRYQEQRETLESIQEQYSVQPNFLVSFWAMESDFGRNQGGFSIIAALATLAYDGRRSAYFRGELLDALRILERGDVTAPKMVGSWAGAMGQCQFMPSVFLKYGVDYDGDGKRNIWSSSADVLASAANYLHSIGWNGNETWGEEVRTPVGFDPDLIGLDRGTKTLSEWGKLGIRFRDGGTLQGELTASLLAMGESPKRFFVVYPNYHVIRQWNRSNYFATSVGLLADAITSRGK